MHKHRLPFIAATLSIVACTEHNVIPLDDAIQVERIDRTIQTETNEVDILWVVDDSQSMSQEQTALAENFDSFIDGLVEIGADFHIAVVTTDYEDERGAFTTGPGETCAEAVLTGCTVREDPVLRYSDYAGEDGLISDTSRDTLTSDFRCLAMGGIRGSTFEAGLDAMEAAFDPAGPNADKDFRRDSAWLSIIFLADENDCSGGDLIEPWDEFDESAMNCVWEVDQLQTVQHYIDFLRSDAIEGVEGGSRIVMAGIIGIDDGVRFEAPDEPIPVCTSQLSGGCGGGQGDAKSCYRYQEVIEDFGDNGVVSDICRSDFSAPLEEIGALIRRNLATKCLRVAPPSCDDDLDCADGEQCLDADGLAGGIELCTDFEIDVELLREGETTWETLIGPGDEGSPDYDVNYLAGNCPSGIGIEFTEGNIPRPGDEFRILYPIRISGETTSEADAGPEPDAE